MLSNRPSRLGTPLTYQMWLTGEANSMCPCARGAPGSARDFDAALVTNDAFVAHTLVRRRRIPSLGGGAKNALTEETIAFLAAVCGS